MVCWTYSFLGIEEAGIEAETFSWPLDSCWRPTVTTTNGFRLLWQWQVIVSSLLSCKNWGRVQCLKMRICHGNVLGMWTLSVPWVPADRHCWEWLVYRCPLRESVASTWQPVHVGSSTHMPLGLPLLLDQRFPVPSSLLGGHDFQLLQHLAAILRKCPNFSASFLPYNAQRWVLCSRQDWPVLSTLRSCYDLDQRHSASLDVPKIVFTLWIMYQPHNTVGPGWASGQFTE